jgi:transcriptional regulator with XRE-family HTH domain
MTTKEMAGRLRKLRERRGLTQKALAEQAGISPGYLARLERALQDPRLSVLEKLARALGCKVSKLID